jgi:RimJ/RimL family protein N-acetyltransferase
MNIKNLGDYFWQGDKVRLRPMQIKDAEFWLKEEIDSEAIHFLNYGIDLPKSEKQAKEFVEKYANFKNTSERIMFSVETLSGDLVGGINIHSTDKKNGTFGIGMRIYRSHRKKGYAEESKRILLRYCFYELRLQKYNVRCIEINKEAIKHFKRMGCKEEGRIRRKIYTNGKYYDELLFGMTKEEFEEIDKKK